jgi:hypothetical protein
MMMKMMKTARLRILRPILGAALPAVLLAACSTAPPRQGPVSAGRTADAPCTNPPPCGDDCSNYPFQPTDCWTTDSLPAKADVIVGNPLTSPNMLYCTGGAYALCFFSGPPTPTGKNPDNPPLPCVLQDDGGFADCTCQVYTSGPYFVDINGILNLGAYYETVQACGQDGSGCANIANCGASGTKPGCADQKQAPVCQYVQNQNPNDPAVSLMPKADLISTFSFAMNGDYETLPTPCEAGLYAGCMTAPCFFPEGAKQPPSDGDPIQCQCPTFNGVYQVGQPNRACTIPTVPGMGGKTYVWSASNTVPSSGQ